MPKMLTLPQVLQPQPTLIQLISGRKPVSLSTLTEDNVVSLTTHPNELRQVLGILKVSQGCLQKIISKAILFNEPQSIVHACNAGASVSSDSLVHRCIQLSRVSCLHNILRYGGNRNEARKIIFSLPPGHLYWSELQSVVSQI